MSDAGDATRPDDRRRLHGPGGRGALARPHATGGPAEASVLWDLSRPNPVRIGLLAGGVLTITLLLSGVLAGYVVRPLRQLTTAADHVADSDLDARGGAGRRGGGPARARLQPHGRAPTAA